MCRTSAAIPVNGRMALALTIAMKLAIDLIRLRLGSDESTLQMYIARETPRLASYFL
jgi:hypothetical protein